MVQIGQTGFSGFNRYIVECKFAFAISDILLASDLIDT